MWPLAFIVICLFLSFALHVAHVESHNADIAAQHAKSLPVPVSAAGALPGEVLAPLPAPATNTTPTWTSYPSPALQHFPQVESVAFNLDRLPLIDDGDFHSRFEDFDTRETHWSYEYAD